MIDKVNYYNDNEDNRKYKIEIYDYSTNNITGIKYFNDNEDNRKYKIEIYD